MVRYWFVGWRRQAIIWTSVKFSSVRFLGIHLIANSLRMPKAIILYHEFEVWNLLPHLSGATKLMWLPSPYISWMIILHMSKQQQTSTSKSTPASVQNLIIYSIDQHNVQTLLIQTHPRKIIEIAFIFLDIIKCFLIWRSVLVWCVTKTFQANIGPLPWPTLTCPDIDERDSWLGKRIIIKRNKFALSWPTLIYTVYPIKSPQDFIIMSCLLLTIYINYKKLVLCTSILRRRRMYV